MSDETRAGQARAVGADRVLPEGDGLVILSRVDMEDWEVRRFRRIRVHYEGRGFLIAGKTAGDDGLVRYTLEPWPDDYPDPPAREIHYDAGYVAERDRAAAASVRREAAGTLLLPLLPLVGFLPSRLKRALHERYGIHAQTATAWSLWVEYAVILLSVAAMALDRWTGILEARILIAIVAVLLPDALIRWNSLLEEDMEPPGFYEWIFRLRLR